MHLNYKQYKCSLCKNGYISLRSMKVGYQFPTFSDIMASPLVKYITLSTNNFWYGGTVEDFIVNNIHPFFFKAKSAASI